MSTAIQADDATLIRLSVSDQEQFTALYDRHAPTIHRYIARRLGTDTADDLMAETFLIAFRKRDRYDPAYPDARPWLYGIATRLIARHRRQEVRRYRLHKRLSSGPEAESPDLDDRVSAQALRGPLGEALAAMPKGLREVLLLVAWADLTYEQVAVALGIPTGTVRSRLSRARVRLRTELGGSDPTEATEENHDG